MVVDDCRRLPLASQNSVVLGNRHGESRVFVPATPLKRCLGFEIFDEIRLKSVDVIYTHNDN